MNEWNTRISYEADTKASSSTRLEDLSQRLESICSLAVEVESSYNSAAIRNLGTKCDETSRDIDESGLINLMMSRLNYLETVLTITKMYLDEV